jgi:DHA1 family bicyclomycin/chloramphenicol resistance-like MFS transporter
VHHLGHITLAQANLSLVAFFVSFSAFLLLNGPLADRFGRRPVLIGGISLYIAGSLLCAGAASITILVLARIIQACAAAAGSAMALTLTKDLYSGNEQKKILAYIGVLIPLCPMVAPSIGALMLQYVSWRGIFLAQATLTLPALYGSFRLKEPMNTDHAGTGGVLAAIRRYGRLARNGAYMGYTRWPFP